MEAMYYTIVLSIIDVSKQQFIVRVYGRWDFKMHKVFNYGISEFATDRCTVTLTQPINHSGSIEKQKTSILEKDTTDEKVVGWHEQTCDEITISLSAN